MSKTLPAKTKNRDIAIGFFGWVILSNLVFVLIFRLFFSLEGRDINSDHVGLAMWLIAIIAILVLYIKKRVGILTGVVAAVVINATILIGLPLLAALQMGFDFDWYDLGQTIMMGSFPLPIGILFFGQ